MKKIFFCFLLIALVTGCSHRMVRTGYMIKRNQLWDCPIPVQKNSVVSPALKKVGTIDFVDCKNSGIRTEQEVITRIRKEACAIDAETANITNENSSDLWKTCYQCRADFYVTYRSKPVEQEKVIDDYKRETDRRKAIIGIVASALLLAVLIYFRPH